MKPSTSPSTHLPAFTMRSLTKSSRASAVYGSFVLFAPAHDSYDIKYKLRYVKGLGRSNTSRNTSRILSMRESIIRLKSS